jgi:iron(III) transport system permease protein
MIIVLILIQVHNILADFFLSSLRHLTHHSDRRASFRSIALLLTVLILCLVLISPLLGLVLSADLWGNSQGIDSAETLSHLMRTVIPRYVLNTIGLVFTVLVTVLVFGVGSAWLIASFRFKGHRLLSGALVLPLAIPSFVMAYAYTDMFDVSGAIQMTLRSVFQWEIGQYWFPQIRSVPGAGLMLGFALYPYVYLVARQAFEERNATAIEAAKTLGLKPWAVWWQVTWPMARPAIAAGATLVMMESVADFGAVSYFAVDTFTTGIYRAWLSMGDKTSAIRLSLMLIMLVGFLVWCERRQRSAIRIYGRNTRKVPPRQLHGKQAVLTFLACAIPVFFGFVFPVIILIKVAQTADVFFDPRMLGWIKNGLLLSSVAACVILLLAIFLSYANRLLKNQFATLASNVAQSGYAMPGLVIAVGMMAAISLLMPSLGGTVIALIFAYAVRFMAVGYQSIDSALQRISPSMDYSARSLGRGVIGVWRDVHWPLIRRAVFAGFLLVFVDCFKELQTTLVMRPLNFDTLAVIAYQFASDERLADAAVPCLVIVAISIVPVLLLLKAERAHDRNLLQ